MSVRKRIFTREWLDTETGSSEQGSWHRVAGVQEVCGQCSQTRGLNFGWSCIDPRAGLDDPCRSLLTHLVRSIPLFVSIVLRDEVVTRIPFATYMKEKRNSFGVDEVKT